MTSQVIKRVYEKNASCKSPSFSGTVIPNRVFVGGIPSNITERALQEVFEKYGKIKKIKIVMDKFGVSKGYGFITYETEDSVKGLQNNANNLIVQNRRVNIAPAVQKMSYVEHSEAQAASGSNVYMANGIPYTYHHGAAFFSTSQQYSSPASVLSPPPVQSQVSPQDNASYYQVYEQASPGHNFVSSAYGTPTIIYPLQSTVPIFLGNQYPSVPTFPNQNSEYVYNTPVPTVTPPTTFTTSNAVTTNRMASSVVTINVDSQAAVIATTDQNNGGTHYGSDLTMSNSVVQPHLMENQSVLQGAPNNLYYNMLSTDVYPVFAVNPQDCPGLQYSEGMQSGSFGIIPNNDCSFQAHNYGSPSASHTSHEIGTLSAEQDVIVQDFIPQSNNQDINYNGDVNSMSSGSVTPNIDNSLQTISYFDQTHQQSQHQQHILAAPVPPPPSYAQQYVIPEHMTTASIPTHHIQEYNSTLVQSTSSVIYPNVDHSQNYLINKLYLGPPVTPVHIQYPRSANGTTYVNDRQPRNEFRNRKRYQPRNEIPDIPRYPFHSSTSDSYNRSTLFNDYIMSSGNSYNYGSFNSNSSTYGTHSRSRSYSSYTVSNNGNNNNNNGNGSTSTTTAAAAPPVVTATPTVTITTTATTITTTTSTTSNHNKYNQGIANHNGLKNNIVNQTLDDNNNSNNDTDIRNVDADNRTLNDDCNVDTKSDDIKDDNGDVDFDVDNKIDDADNQNSANNAVMTVSNVANSATDRKDINTCENRDGNTAILSNKQSNNNNLQQKDTLNNGNNKGRVFRNQTYQPDNNYANSSYGSRRRFIGNVNNGSGAITNNLMPINCSGGNNTGSNGHSAAAMYNSGNALFAARHGFIQSVTLKQPSSAAIATAAAMPFPQRMPSPFYNSYTYPPQYNYQQRKYNDFPKRSSNQNYGARYRASGSRHNTRYQEDLYSNASNNVAIVPLTTQEPKQIIPRPLTSPGVTAPLPRSPRPSNSSQQSVAPAARNIDMCAQIQNLSIK